MADPFSRRKSVVNRLRTQLKKKNESLADQFDFKMYIVFNFKDVQKEKAVFEVNDVMPVMTNNYEESIMKGVKEEAYSLESSLELLRRDVVQLHAQRWRSLRKDVMGCTSGIDFHLWPRSDVHSLSVLLFSKWKGDGDHMFKPHLVKFEFLSADYERQLTCLFGKKKENANLVICNPGQSVFLFLDRQYIQAAKSNTTVFKLSSLCLYISQDQLMHWAPGSVPDLLSPSPLQAAASASRAQLKQHCGGGQEVDD